MEAHIPRTTRLCDIELKYEQLDCISRGAFSSIYLAKERHLQGRMVAIKSIRLNKQSQKAYLREIDCLMRLNQSDDQNNRDFAVVLFHESFALEDYSIAFIVMNYVAGGTLMAEWIEKNTNECCSERRITWYIVQLCETLAYIHERGIVYYDLNPNSILIDTNDGGKLVLTDFGSVNPFSGDSEDFTVFYASPEVLAAKRFSAVNLHGIDVAAIDSFAIGCVALELLSGTSISKMKGLHGRTLGDFLMQKGSLSELEPKMKDNSIYTALLRNELISKLLDPNPITRSNSSFFPHYLRYDPRSPLLAPLLEASHPAQYRHHVTMDNISLGLFVQRGHDWQFGDDSDGGYGSVGVVTALDPDALYTTVTWSNGNSDVYRIGAKASMEIAVGPPIFNDKPSGLVMTNDVAKYTMGYPYNATKEKLHHGTGGLIVAHIEKSPANSSGIVIVVPRLTCQFLNENLRINKNPQHARGTHNRKITPHDPESVPSYWSNPEPNNWNPGAGRLVQIDDIAESDFVTAMSYELLCGGYKIVNIQRCQSERLWTAFARRREEIALENFGCANEMRLFHGTSKVAPERIMNDPIGFDPRFCDQGAFGRGSYFAVNPMYSDAYRYSLDYPTSTTFQMFLARVALGRVQNLTGNSAPSLRRPETDCHSIRGNSINRKRNQSEIFVIYETDTQAYPEYLITYQAA